MQKKQYCGMSVDCTVNHNQASQQQYKYWYAKNVDYYSPEGGGRQGPPHQRTQYRMAVNSGEPGRRASPLTGQPGYVQPR